ncbi:hypothetical protein BCR35DRAFT_323209 [Leucosporidium creatinivorum]|uniref:Spondin domain-containing protein n=1 Tax=Leucosporidium creatinivorum TaxID=106004 RepID=A0A1Y2G4I8_9BASI|nr:hypothetical protein BCR35DRAFT_323209 [Leucosporidium creatinivorum]
MSWRPTLSLEGLGFGLGKKSTITTSTTPTPAAPLQPQVRATPPPPTRPTRSPSQSATSPPPVAHQSTQLQPTLAPAPTITTTTSAAAHSPTTNASQQPLDSQPPTAMQSQPTTSNQPPTPAAPPTTLQTAPTPSAAPPLSSAPSTVHQPLPSPSKTPLFFSEPNDDGYISSDLSEAEEIDQLASNSEATNPAPIASTSRAILPATPSSRASPNHFTPSVNGGSSATKKAKQPRASNSASRPSGGARINGTIPPLPHYSVVRSSNNSQTDPHRIIINPGVTDGSRSRWVTNTTPGQVVAGRLNWHELQSPTEGKHKAWRYGLGKELADKLELNTPKPGGKPDFWILDNWPDNYQFTVHHTAGKGNGLDRLDAYLHGSAATVKFRTVNEFTPHLYWLLTHGPNDNLTCKCKYCAKKTQTEVNASLGLENYRAPSVKRESSIAGSSVGGGHGSGRPAKKIKRSLEFSDEEEEDEVVVDTGYLADKTRKGNKLAREKPRKPKKDATPTYSGTYVNKERDTDLSDGALYRVGELVWVELPTPFVDLKMGTSERITHWIAVVAERTIRSISSKKPSQVLQPGVAPFFDNKQTFAYRCSLLAVDAEVTKTEQHLQAWLADSPHSGLLAVDRIVAQESVRHAWDPKLMQCRRPKLEEMVGLHQAITPFALASQIAAHIAGSFCLVDRYKITADHLHTSSTITQEERLRRDKTLDFYHYQCLWWGGERIWSGELVRLVPNLDSFPEGPIPHSKGANQRSLFLQISAIYKDKETDQAKLAGKLFELRDLKGVTEIEGEEGGSALSRIEGTGSSSNGVNGNGKGKSTSPSLSPSPSILDPHLPSPPPGFEFRSLNRRGSSTVIDAEYVAGRYYNLPLSLQSRQEIERVLSKVPPLEEVVGDTVLDRETRAVALAGLTHARVVYMTCSTWTVDRHTAITDAEHTAQKEMSDWFQAREEESSDSASASVEAGTAGAGEAMDLSV